MNGQELAENLVLKRYIYVLTISEKNPISHQNHGNNHIESLMKSHMHHHKAHLID